jgi:phosphoglycerate dehydrogenase-like enzyme
MIGSSLPIPMSSPSALFVLGPAECDLIYGPECLGAIARKVRLLAPPFGRDQIAAHATELAETELLFSGWGAPRMDADFLAAAPKLRAVFYGAGSIRSVVSEAFWERGIAITSAYAMNAIPVAEFSLGTILLSLKHTWHFALKAKQLGRFPERSAMPGAYGSTVGLVSLGMIGRLVRERLRPFDLKVIAYDPYLTPAAAAEFDVESVGLEELFARADVVSLHTPWLRETEGLITGRHFERMRPGATFINTARGAVVREDEMIAALRRRPEIYAVLDVTHPEPPAPGSPLYTLPNVVLTPHIAGSLGRECRRMGQCMLEELERWLAGEPLRYGIDRARAAVMA